MNNHIEIQENTLRKTFRDRICFDHERTIYHFLTDTGLAPELLEQHDMTLLTRYIDAPSLADVLSGGTMPAGLEDALLRWQTGFLDRCHDHSGMWIAADDLNPRNLLVTADGMIGIDFEDWHAGSLAESCAAMPAMIRMMRLPEDIRADLARRLETRLARYYDIPLEHLQLHVEDQCAAINFRRQVMPVLRRSACAVLTGGKSSRMGTDKSMLVLDGYTFLELILHTVQIFDRISLSAARPADPSPYPIIPDIVSSAGPAGALQAILAAAETPHIMIVPCDTPLLTRKTILAMYAELDETADAVVLRCGRRDYPVIGIYWKRILPVLETMLRDKNYRMKDLLSQVRTRYHVTANEKEIFNVNTPEDLETIRILYESGQ